MSGTTGLEVRNLTVRFGGLLALDRVSLTTGLGHLTGLIGPNGAGKTTLFNCCSGQLIPSEGEVRFGGRDLTRLSVAERALCGMGRTFQRIQLFDSLTVAENIAMGREAALAGSSVLRQVIPRPGDRARVDEATLEACELCGVEHLVGRRAGNLSTGQRRLVELARCLAGSFELLLLDEPSSGLDERETAAFGRVLTEVVRSRGTGILLVEHDMDLVMSVCEYLYVLDFGRLIFEGTPGQVQTSDTVRAAYLGVNS